MGAPAFRARITEATARVTVRDLVAGSGLHFNARGSYVFPELGGDTPLFAVQ